MKQNIVDKVISFIAPEIGVRRMLNRERLEDMTGTTGMRKFDGASRGRNTEDFTGTSSSSNVENQTGFVLLRNRSRELHRNDAYTKNWLRVMPNNIIGTGIIPTPVVSGRSGKADRAKEVWKLWAEKVKCDYDQRYNFYGLQHLILKTVFMSGECLIVRRRATSKYTIPLRLQVLEADYIDNGKFSLENEYGGITWYGIAFNKQGERVGYWLWNRHPGEFATHSSFIDAKDIIHVYNAERPGQIRGIPENHAVLLDIKDLKDYEYNERIRAKIASCMVGAITQDETNGKDDLASSFDTMEPGTFHKLRPGETVAFNTPPTSTGYPEYVKGNKHKIAAGVGTTHEALTGDLSNVNFSSGRMGWLEFQRNVNFWQNNIMIPFCDTAFEWFVEAAQMAAMLPMGASFDARWTPPRREMIDPYKETKALLEKVRGKFTTWEEAIKEFGDNPEEVLVQLIKEHGEMKKAGLMPTSFPEFDANRNDVGGKNADRTDPGAARE